MEAFIIFQTNKNDRPLPQGIEKVVASLCVGAQNAEKEKSASPH